MSFRDNLLHLRASRNMTQEQLAMLLGVSRQSVTKWESEKSYPEMDKLLKMCALFECTLDDLVQGDLSSRHESAAATPAAMPDGPATDVCGYDEHMRAFSVQVPTGIACIVLGIAWTVFFDEGPTGILRDGDVLSIAGLFAGILAGLAFLIPAGMRHSSFVKAHPYIEDFYTAEQKTKAGRRCGISIVASVGIIFLGVLIMISTDKTGYENVGAAVLTALVAIAVWFIVNTSMMYSRTNLAEYNQNAIDELELEDIAKAAVDEERKKALLAAHGIKTRKQRLTSNLCGIIMIVASIAGLVMLFWPIAQGVDPDDVDWRSNLFWMAWVVGGLCCGIVALAVNAFVDDE